MSILSTSQISQFTGLFAQHFDAFSTTTITVFKEPEKIINTVPNSNSYPGYGTPALEQDITYVPVSGQFPAMVIHFQKDQKLGDVVQTRHSLPAGLVRIKVKQDARDYINNGKTELINVNGQDFNQISDDGMQNYFGIEYFYFLLQRVD